MNIHIQICGHIFVSSFVDTTYKRAYSKNVWIVFIISAMYKNPSSPTSSPAPPHSFDFSSSEGVGGYLTVESPNDQWWWVAFPSAYYHGRVGDIQIFCSYLLVCLSYWKEFLIYSKWKGAGRWLSNRVLTALREGQSTDYHSHQAAHKHLELQSYRTRCSLLVPMY